MCFSAQMSFIASAVLAAVAALSYRAVHKPKELPLATVPVLFSLQQFAEGLLWVFLPQDGHPMAIAGATYIFLTTALIIWPVFIPFALLMLEKHTVRRLIIATCLTIGIAWSCVSSWYLLTHGASVSIDGAHLLYQLPGHESVDYTQMGLYSISVVLPFFATSSRSLQLLGGIIALSALASYLLYYTYFISIWCFFAALISVSIYAIIRYQLD